MPRYDGFIGGSYQSQSVIADTERTVNLYVEKMQSDGAKNRMALYPTPGFQRWSSGTDVGSRGALVANGRLFWVLGGALWEFTADGTATKRGTIAQDSNPAQLIYNGVVGGQLGIVSGGNVYAFTLATNVLSGALLIGGYSMLAYSDGYGLAFNATTGKVQLSDLNDLTTWSLGTFFQRSKFPDPWQTMFVDPNGLIWLIGTDTFEVWYDTGTGTQPFAPLSGLVGRYGIAAPFAFGLAGPSPCWLTRNPEGAGILIAMQGAAANPVSTYAVNTAIAGYQRTSRITDAEILVYQDQGHTFINTAFPSAPATLSYDLEGQSWAERGKKNSLLNRYDLWSPRVHCYAFGKHLIGDRATGQLSEMDVTLSTEIDGTGIHRLRRAPGLTHEHARVAYDRLELLMDVGLGLPSGQGSNPQVMLRTSDDGGRTWGNERIAGFGRIGEYRRRVYWNRLGTSMDRVFEVSVSDPVPVRFIDAWINNQTAEAA